MPKFDREEVPILVHLLVRRRDHVDKDVDFKKQDSEPVGRFGERQAVRQVHEHPLKKSIRTASRRQKAEERRLTTTGRDLLQADTISSSGCMEANDFAEKERRSRRRDRRGWTRTLLK